MTIDITHELPIPGTCPACYEQFSALTTRLYLLDSGRGEDVYLCDDCADEFVELPKDEQADRFEDYVAFIGDYPDDYEP